MADNSEQLETASNIFSVIDLAWGAVVDKFSGQPLGTTATSRYGALASGLGGLAAYQKFSNSNQQPEDIDGFLLDMASQLPGIPGMLMAPVSWLHEKIGDVFDGGESEQQLLGFLLSVSDLFNIRDEFEGSIPDGVVIICYPSSDVDYALFYILSNMPLLSYSHGSLRADIENGPLTINALASDVLAVENDGSVDDGVFGYVKNKLSSDIMYMEGWVDEIDYDQLAMQFYGYASPIAIDLEGDGFDLISIYDGGVYFDLDGDSQVERVGWLSGKDGFLAYDLNGNGRVDGINELFGGMERGVGYAKLAELDSNQDGFINELDDSFGGLSIWQDYNLNGKGDEGELKLLGELGITDLEIDYFSTNLYIKGNLIGEKSSARINGKQVEMADIYFRYDTGVSKEKLAEPLDDEEGVENLDSRLLNGAGYPEAFRGTGAPKRGEGSINLSSFVSYSCSDSRGGRGAEFQQTSAKLLEVAGGAVVNTLNGVGGTHELAQAPFPALDCAWFERWLERPVKHEESTQGSMEEDSQTIERHWARLARTLSWIDTERQSGPSWLNKARGVDISNLSGFSQADNPMWRLSSEVIGLNTGAVKLKGFAGLREGVNRLAL